MNELQTITNIDNRRMMLELEGAAYVGMGRTNFRTWAREIGARRKFGRAVRYDKVVIDKALDEMKPDNGEDEG